MYPQLNIEFNARSAAMAGASMAILNSSSGVLANPASAAEVQKMEAYIGYSSVLAGIWGAPLSITRSFGKYGVFGVSAVGITSGQIEVTDLEGDLTGENSSADYLTGVITWAYKVRDDLSIGASFKGLYTRLIVPQDLGGIVSAKGMAFDVGAKYRMSKDRFIAGIALRNAGFNLQRFYNDSSSSLPLTFEVGVSYLPVNIPWRFALDINQKLGDYLNFEPGLEINVYKRVLFLRLGYGFSGQDLAQKLRTLNGNEDENYVKSNWNTLCFGAGFTKNIENSSLQIDLAFQFHSAILTPSTVISASVEF
jgi:hypothetical protein